MATIKELMKGRTTFIVTHRLGTIHKVDKIVVMEHGRIVEQGTGPELLGRGRDLCETVSVGQLPGMTNINR